MKFPKLRISFKPKKIGIDLGTANSVVFVEGEGLVLQEPTIVAIALSDLSIVAIGNQAKLMLGKTPDTIIVKRPLRHGVIASAKVTTALLSYFVTQVLGNIRFFKPEIMISAPAGITSVEKRAIIKAALQAGAKKVHLIPEPLAAAIGANLPIHESVGNMIVNMGGGTAEIAVISLNGIVIAESVRIAGDEFNEIIISYFRKKMGLLIGEQMAEKAKMKIGSAIEVVKPRKMEIGGRDVGTGLPRLEQIDSNQIAEALKTPLRSIVRSIKQVLEKTPPELSADVMERGITMSGGTSQLWNLDKLFTHALGVPAYVAEDPLNCVVKGTGEALQHIDILEKSLTNS